MVNYLWDEITDMVSGDTLTDDGEHEWVEISEYRTPVQGQQVRVFTNGPEGYIALMTDAPDEGIARHRFSHHPRYKEIHDDAD